VFIRSSADGLRGAFRSYWNIGNDDSGVHASAALARKHRLTVMLGRTLLQQAVPITFGLKLALWYDEMKRNLARLNAAAEDLLVGKISGAVGAFGHIGPDAEEKICARLGLKPADIASQVIARDRHAAWVAALALLTATLEKIALEIRHLQRTEVREAEEFFSEGQKGSSSMPHKRNPVLTENLTGLARVVRSAVMPALENVTLWHERDISHSSAERYIAPDATVTLDFALNRLASVVEQLVVYGERMKGNLDSLGGVIFSQRVLLALTQKGMSREDSYAAVQRNAMEAWRGNASFLALCRADQEIRQFLSDDELVALFDMGYHTKHVDTIFKRVFG